LVRVRSAGGQPFSFPVTPVPPEIGESRSGSDPASGPLFRLLERSGTRIDHAAQSISACLATPVEAEAPGTTHGSALLKLTRILFDRSGRGVERLSAHDRPDRSAHDRPDRLSLERKINRTGQGEARQWTPVVVEGAGDGPPT
jgi:GntR family transcriptional regulator